MKSRMKRTNITSRNERDEKRREEIEKEIEEKQPRDDDDEAKG